MAKGFPGAFEQMVLLAVLQLGERALLPAIALELEERANRDVSRGGLYTTLDRLEAKGYVRWEILRSSSRHGGGRKRRFEVTPAGVRALRVSREALLSLWDGLDPVLQSRLGSSDLAGGPTLLDRAQVRSSIKVARRAD